MKVSSPQKCKRKSVLELAVVEPQPSTHDETGTYTVRLVTTCCYHSYPPLNFPMTIVSSQSRSGALHIFLFFLQWTLWKLFVFYVQVSIVLSFVSIWPTVLSHLDICPTVLSPVDICPTVLSLLDICPTVLSLIDECPTVLSQCCHTNVSDSESGSQTSSESGSQKSTASDGQTSQTNAINMTRCGAFDMFLFCLSENTVLLPHVVRLMCSCSCLLEHTSSVFLSSSSHTITSIFWTSAVHLFSCLMSHICFLV